MPSIGVGLSVDARQRFTAIYSAKAVGGFTGSNKILSAAGQVQDFRPGQTLWLVFQSTGVGVVTTENVLSCCAGSLASGKGWWLTRQASTGTLYLLSPASNFLAIYTPPVHSITAIALVWRASDNHVLCTVNGGPQVDAGACGFTAADSSCASYIGTESGSLGGVALASGRVLAYALWGTEATASQCQANTFTQTSRFELSATVRASATVDFDATRDWGGIASTITTAGSSPVTFSVVGSPSRVTVSEMRIAATSALYHDSRLSMSSIDVSGYAYTTRDSYARLRVNTDGLYAGVESYSTLWNTFPGQSVIGLFKNGSFVGETAMLQYAKPQLFDLQLGGGTSKTIDIVEGPQVLSGAGPTRLGSFVQAIRIPVLLEDGATSANSTAVKPAPPQKRLVLMGDSIITGFFASALTQKSQATLLRGSFPASGTGGVTAFCVATDSAYNEAYDAPTAAATAAKVAAELDGTTWNKVWIALGTNDYAFNVTTAAAFETRYALLVDAIHAAAPAATVFCQTPIPRVSPASEAANGVGSTLADFRAAIANVVSTRASFCSLVDGTTFASFSGGMYADGIHLNDTGCAAFAAAIDGLVDT